MENKIVANGRVFILNDSEFAEVMRTIQSKSKCTFPVGYANNPSGMKYQNENQKMDEGTELILE